MIRIFICPHCKKVRLVSKYLTAKCYECEREMTMCRIPYTEWVDLSMKDRETEIRKYIKSGKN